MKIFFSVDRAIATYFLFFALSLVVSGGALVWCLYNKRKINEAPSKVTINRSWFQLALIVSMTVYFLVFTAVTWQNFHHFRLHAKDFGYFDNMLWNTARGRVFYSTLTWKSFLGEHFSPILFFLVPFYALGLGPHFLLLVQSLALALAAFFLYRLADTRLKNGFLALAFALAYLLSPLVQGPNICDFHMEIFEPLIIFAIFYFISRDWAWPYFVSLGFLFLCKEDTVFYGLAIGLYLFLFIPGRKKVALLTLVSSLVWAFLAFRLFIPFFRGAGGYAFISRYGWLGGSPMGILKTLVTRPVFVCQNLLTVERLRGLTALLLPWGFLPFLGGGAILVALPSIFEMVLSNYPYQYKIAAHYSVVVIPFVIVAAVSGVEYLLKEKKKPGFFGWWSLSIQIRSFVLGVFLLTMAVLSSWQFGFSPISHHFDRSIFKFNNHIQLGQKFLQQIPAGASVCAQDGFFAHLAHRREIYLFRGLQEKPFTEGQPEFLVFDWSAGSFPLGRDKFREQVKKIITAGSYGVVAYEDGFILLRKGFSREKNAACLKLLS